MVFINLHLSQFLVPSKQAKLQISDMGEFKEDATSPDQKTAAAGEAKDDGSITAVYRIDMHCEGCASKIRRVVKNYDGVVDVKADCSANKLTVTGKMDPIKVKEKLEKKIKKRVELVSPLPKKDDGVAGDDKKADEKPEKKAEEKKPKEASTLILKIRLHCDDCIQKLSKIIMKINGVDSIDVESGRDLVTVKGTMDGKQLIPYLKEKLRRNIELIQPKKDDGAAVEAKEESELNVAGSGEKKDDETGAAEKKPREPDAGGENKQEEAVSGKEKNEKEVGTGKEKEGAEDQKEGTEKAAMNSYEGGKTQENESEGVEAQENKMEFYGDPQYPNLSYFHGGNLHSTYIHEYVNQGYMVPPQLHAPQIFSDENPNACSIM